MIDRIRRKQFLLVMIALMTVGYSGYAQTAYGTHLSEKVADHMVTIPLLNDHSTPTLDFNASPWTQAACLTGFLGYIDQTIAEELTWVYVFYDRSALWIGYRCEGRNAPFKTVFTEHDDRVWWDDGVEFHIACMDLRKDHYHIVVNAAGVFYDAKNKMKEWQSDIDVKATSDAISFSVIMRIPFATLGSQTPRAGETWTVNFCRNTPEPSRSSWSPTPLDHQEPEYFGRMVFGGKDTPAVRLRKIDPVGIGTNRMAIDASPGLHYTLTGKNEKHDQLFAQQQPVPAKGVIDFLLTDDRIHLIELSLNDQKGKPLARFWYPKQTPDVAARIATLKAQFDDIQKGLEQFPESTRKKASDLLASVQPALDEAVQTVSDVSQYTPANWKRLDWAAAQLAERLDNAAAYARTRAIFPKADFAVGLESSMRKVMIRDHAFSGYFNDHYDLALARNEHEAFQVVVIPFDRDLNDATVSVSPLRGPQSADGCHAEVSLVGHVEVVDHTPYVAQYRGWWPDILLNFQHRCDVRCEEHVAFWIDVATESNAKPGLYQSSVTVTAAHCKPIKIQLNVTVWDFELPQGTHLRNAFTFARSTTKHHYRDEWNQELAYKYYDFILDHRLNIDDLYRGNAPDLDVIEYGMSKGMNAFNVGADFKKIDKQGPDEYLDEYVARLKKEGWLDEAYAYGFDEIKTKEDFEAMKKAFGRIHRFYPGLKTMTTAQDRSFGLKTGMRDEVDIWVPLTDVYSVEAAEKLRAEGKKMWWYICVVPYPPYANWFVESPAIEARLLMGAMSYKYQVDGFLYYLINSWQENRHDVTAGPYTTWDPGTFTNRRGERPNGDGSLMCPGPDGPLSTIRMENIRDGIEDYEYLYLLADLAEQVGQLPKTSDRKAFLKRAKKLLVVPDDVVNTVTDFTYHPKDLSSYRCKLSQAILEGKSFQAK